MLHPVLQSEREAAKRLAASQLRQWQDRPGIGANVLSKNPSLYEKLEQLRAGRFS